jgi:hypothetical protein
MKAIAKAFYDSLTEAAQERRQRIVRRFFSGCVALAVVLLTVVLWARFGMYAGFGFFLLVLIAWRVQDWARTTRPAPAAQQRSSPGKGRDREQ